MTVHGPESAGQPAGLSGELSPRAVQLLSDGAERGEVLLSRLFDVEPRDWLRAVPGRGTFRWPQPPRESAGAVVKRFLGDSQRERLYERVRGRARAPGLREFDNLKALAADGFPVPGALGWAVAGGRSLVVMECVPHRETLRARLAHAAPQEVGAWCARLLALVTRLHATGWYHRDLYLQHFLVVEGTGSTVSLCLIDVGRARREGAPRTRWFIKDLGALLASTPDAVPPVTRLRFLAGYLDAQGVHGRAQRRRWARKIERRRRAIVRHRPRFGEAGDALPERLP